MVNVSSQSRVAARKIRTASYIGAGVANGGNGGGGGVLPAFAYQAETDTLAASFTAAPTRRRKRTMDYAFRTLKAAGISVAPLDFPGFYVGQPGKSRRRALVSLR